MVDSFHDLFRCSPPWESLRIPSIRFTHELLCKASQLGFLGLLLGLLNAERYFQNCSRIAHSVPQGNHFGDWVKVKSELFGICPGNKRNLSLICNKLREPGTCCQTYLCFSTIKVEMAQFYMIFNHSMGIRFYSGMEIQ